MNDDYLWDKSGQPDPEVQQLEEILGTLRYQPRPLQIPNDLPMPQRRNYFPVFAIAATVLVALLAAGIWLRVRRENDSQPQQANFSVAPTVEEKQIAGPEPQKELVAEKTPAQRDNKIAVNKQRRNKSLLSGMRKREREEALAAKEQVMLALRLASEKINLVHRKTQHPAPANQIKNQHRVG